jgi:predicted RecB family endonuclease
VAERLRRGGMDVVYVGNAGSFDHPRTLVVDRIGCGECAQAVADELGVRIVTVEIDSLRLVEVTVILGHDLGTSEGT